MTTATTTAPSMPRPAAGPAPAVPTIDIVKILIQNVAWLVGALIVGVALGIGAFVLLRQFAPSYQSEAIVSVSSPRGGMDEITATGDDKELDRFINSQVAQMKSEGVISAVAGDPRTRAQAPGWAKKFEQGPNFDLQAATEDLTKRVYASAVPNTTLVKLGARHSTQRDALALATRVREQYLTTLAEQSGRGTLGLRTEYERQIREASDSIRQLQQDRATRILASGTDSIDEKSASIVQQISEINKSIAEVRNLLTQTQTTLDKHRQQLELTPGSIVYPDTVIDTVESDPAVRTIRQRISDIEAQIASMQQEGYGPEHRAIMSLRAQRESWVQELEKERQKLLRQKFDALVDSLDTAVGQYRAQEADLLRRLEEATTERGALSRLILEIENLDLEIDEAIRRRGDAQAELENLRSLSSLPDSSRVSVVQYERLPEQVAFPKPIIIIPGVTILCVAGVFGVIFLREMLDQRIKSPSDIAVSRARVLAVIPDGAQTADGGGEVHRIFKDKPNSVLAESFRQARAPLVERMRRSGLKSVTIISGNPESGATTFATNFALSCAATEMKVLLIDANFRRPRLHTILGGRESPGLADALAGTPVAEAVQALDDGHLDLLSAGSGSLRVVERLSTEALTRIIDEAERAYDLVVVDVPPIVVAGDAKTLASRTDATVLVVRAFGETRGLVGRIRQELEHASGEFLGVVVNRVRASAGGYMRSNLRATAGYQSVKG